MSNTPMLVDSGEKMSAFLSKSGTQEYLASVLGEKKEKFVTNLASIASQDKALAECTNISVMSGAIVATTLGLSLNKAFGYAYLVPFKNKKLQKTEAQFQIGYKGYIQLAMRTGEYRKLNAVPIYENQFVRWNEMEEELTLNDVDGEGAVVGYVAFFELLNGFKKMMFWRYSKMIRHADEFSMAFNKEKYKLLKEGKIPQGELWKYSSFWYKDFDSMALKTMLRQLLSKYGILSEDMQRAYEYDQAVVSDSEARYVDNEPMPRETVQPVVEQADPMSGDGTVIEAKVMETRKTDEATEVNLDDIPV